MEEAASVGAPVTGPVAILPWGDVIEDFLDDIGMTLNDFADQTSGGWLFGYVDALATAGVPSIIVCFSARVDRPLRMQHVATRATIWVLPASRTYRAARTRITDPQRWTSGHTVRNARRARRVGISALRHVAPFLATPLKTLGRTLRREGCVAMLCQEYEYPRFDACVLLGRVLGLPVFATFQGGRLQGSALERYLRPASMRACRGVLIGSAEEAQRVRSRYRLPPEKVFEVPNPFSVDAWQQRDRRTSRAELGIDEGAQVIAWHGRVDIRNKGLDVLLDAWQQLLNQRAHRSMRLLLIGTGCDAAELHRRIDATGRRGIVWLDQYVLDRSALARHLSAADVYAFPSRREGFPLAPVEAMACGLPVAAAAAPGVAEILVPGDESGGLLVPVGNSRRLAEALTRLLDDDSYRHEMSHRARRTAETKFASNSIGQLLADILTRPALAERRSGLPEGVT